MALYIPHSIFHLARLLYVRPETFGPYYIASQWFTYALLTRFGPRDFFLFSRLWSQWWGTKFQDIAEIKLNSTWQLPASLKQALKVEWSLELLRTTCRIPLWRQWHTVTCKYFSFPAVNSVQYVFYQPLHNYIDVTIPWELKHVCHNVYNKCNERFQSLHAQFVQWLQKPHRLLKHKKPIHSIEMQTY